MATDEFGLIERFFKGTATPGIGVRLGIGDDAAVLDPGPGVELVATVDTLVAGVHFPVTACAAAIGQRALRVNLSDLAAMGATPRWFLLALSLPTADEDWLAGFSTGLATAAARYGCALVGGDTTRGTLTISITALGTVPAGAALTRGGASVGDLVLVTGTLGGSAAALAEMQRNGATRAQTAALDADYWYPEPRLTEGQALRGLASAAIDISDGLLADLGHVVRASGVGAELTLDALPLSTAAVARFGLEQTRAWALSAGDDYQLCFTVPPTRLAEVEALAGARGFQFTRIGRLAGAPGVRVRDAAGREVAMAERGFRHF